MTNHMLIAIDGSDASMKAVDYAAKLAATNDATATMMHVVPSGSMPDGLRQWAEAEHVADSPKWLYAQGVGEAVLNAAQVRWHNYCARSPEHLIEEGNVAGCILATARALPADTLVLGSRGFGGLEGLLLGSVTHKVLNHAPCTVIVVR